MKKYLLIPFFIFFFSTTAFASWVDSGANVYFTGGNVGIGTSTPAYSLEVNGAIYATGGGINTNYNLYVGGNSEFVNGLLTSFIAPRSASADIIFKNYSASEKMRILDNGNVGIGTSTPAYELDVSGDINFTGDLYQNGSLVTFGDTLLSPQMEYALQFFGLFFIFLSLIKFIIQLSRYLL